MKPFNLQEALAGKPVVTRDGRTVTALHLFDCDLKFPLGAVIESCSCIYAFRKDGTWTSEPSEYDLFMASVEKTVWVNLYQHAIFRHETEQEADAGLISRYVEPRLGGKAFPITYEE